MAKYSEKLYIPTQHKPKDNLYEITKRNYQNKLNAMADITPKSSMSYYDSMYNGLRKMYDGKTNTSPTANVDKTTGNGYNENAKWDEPTYNYKPTYGNSQTKQSVAPAVYDDKFKKNAENQWYNKIAHGSFKENDWFDAMVKNQEKAQSWYNTAYGKEEGTKEYRNLHNRLINTPLENIKKEEKQFANYTASDFKVPEIKNVNLSYNSPAKTFKQHSNKIQPTNNNLFDLQSNNQAMPQNLKNANYTISDFKAPELQPVKYSYNDSGSTATNVKSKKTENSSSDFDYNTRLSYNQTFNPNVKLLQKRLSELGYLDMSDGDWGYFGSKTQDAVNRYKNDNGLGNTGADKGVVGKQTWTSLGLICREQKDIDAGVQIKIIGDKQYFDISAAVMNAIHNSQGEFAAHSGEFMWFINQVGNKGDWNVKRNTDIWSKTLGISAKTYRNDLIFFGRVVSKEDVGNITYGYLGKAAGFSDEMLYMGSMGNHTWTHLTRDWDNEFADHEFIQLGIDLYNEVNIEVRYGKG